LVAQKWTPRMNAAKYIGLDVHALMSRKSQSHDFVQRFVQQESANAHSLAHGNYVWKWSSFNSFHKDPSVARGFGVCTYIVQNSKLDDGLTQIHISGLSSGRGVSLFPAL
jgi:hypothetical protein